MDFLLEIMLPIYFKRKYLNMQGCEDLWLDVTQSRKKNLERSCVLTPQR